MAKKKTPSPIRFYTSLIEQIKTNKVAFAVFLVLRLAVILVIIRCIVDKRYESIFTAGLALILFLIPPFVEKNFKIELPTVLETLAYIFIFCAEIFGEISGFYQKFAFWDTMLHVTNGFIFAAVGFCLIDIINQNPKIKFRTSPVYVAITAFCFSMTIGVFWEFFEFAADRTLLIDMQKDRIINSFSSLTHPIDGQIIENITKTTIEYGNGQIAIIERGYLDIGLIDTIKDMFVNFIGAVVFSVIGYFYIKHRGKGKIAKQFIPVLMHKDNKNDELPDENPDIDKYIAEKSADENISSENNVSDIQSESPDYDNSEDIPCDNEKGAVDKDSQIQNENTDSEDCSENSNNS